MAQLRFTDVVLAYLIIGIVMWGGGALQYDQAGPISHFVAQDETTDELEKNQQTTGHIESAGKSITSVISQFGGGAVIVWNLFVGLFAYMNWPLTTLWAANAPPRLVLLIGGSFTAAFYLSIGTLIKQSA